MGSCYGTHIGSLCDYIADTPGVIDLTLVISYHLTSHGGLRASANNIHADRGWFAHIYALSLTKWFGARSHGITGQSSTTSESEP